MDAVDPAAGEQQLEFREQIALSNAISWVDSLLIHEANGGASVAQKLGAALVLQSLEPVLTFAWPDRPDVENLDEFVLQARARFLSYLRDEKGSASFVPAVEWDHGGRVHLSWSTSALTLIRLSVAAARGTSSRRWRSWRAASP